MSCPVRIVPSVYPRFPLSALSPGSPRLGSARIKKNGHKKKKGDHVQILTGSQDRSPLPAPERPPLFRSYSAAHSRLLAARGDRLGEGRRRGEAAAGSVHMLSEVGQGGLEQEGRRSLGRGERNFRTRGQRLRQGSSARAAESRGGVRKPVFPPRGSVNLKRHQRERAECDFLQLGLRNYQ